jgi:hypothetical protein
MSDEPLVPEPGGQGLHCSICRTRYSEEELQLREIEEGWHVEGPVVICPDCLEQMEDNPNLGSGF